MGISRKQELMSNSSSRTSVEDEREGTLSSSSHEENGLDNDEVYELEFGETTKLADSIPKPVAKPRRRLDRSRHASAPGLALVENGVDQPKQTLNKTESHDQHPTPTRSAPAPPDAVTDTHGDRVSCLGL